MKKNKKKYRKKNGIKYFRLYKIKKNGKKFYVYGERFFLSFYNKKYFYNEQDN